MHRTPVTKEAEPTRGRVQNVRLAEGGKLDQIVVGHAFDRVSGFAPGAQASADDKNFEPKFLKLMRHTGAGGFACSSTVEINLSILGKVLHLFNEVVGLNADGSRDTFGVGIVISVAADVSNEHVTRRVGG